MNEVQLLDCTLRDGGYCNQWNFGVENTHKIIKGLIDANIDIIECGFLTNRVSYTPGITKFTSIDELSSIIPKEKDNKLFVCMINYGEYNLDDIPNYDGSSIDGIRIAFHKKDLTQALEFCKGIKLKGYKVFIQPMISLKYSDEEFIDLIQQSNLIEPYAFYIVDSFGVMKRKDLIRLFYMVEHNLSDNIYVGYHSHNNMQLAYSNAQELVDIRTKRNIIIDVTIFGMGRGAGNLNTELFLEYLNDNINGQYILKPILIIIDEILNDFYQQNYWGYSLPNYLSASHNLHPNYASYLSDKNTLTIEDIDEIFLMMSLDKKINFDKSYIEELYLKYMANGKIQEEHLNELKELLSQKRVLLIAPGKSSIVESSKIIDYANKEDIISISINCEYPMYNTDFVFISNIRRFKELKISNYDKCIVTSNINVNDVYLKTPYNELINNIETVKDNAGLMLIQFLINLGVKEVLLAGFDGYSHDIDENYTEHQIVYITKNAILDAMNVGMSSMITKYSSQINIKFVTKPKYVNINERKI